MTGRPERHQVLVTRSDGSVFDLRYARLQLKYGQRWIRKVFPHKRQKQAEAGEEQCSAQFLILKHDSGLADTVLEGHEMQLLAPGAFLFANMPTLVDSIPPAFPNNCFFMPGRNQDWSNNLENYMTIVFSERTRVYILLSTLQNEPKWLRGKFHKLRDPNFSEVHIKVNWRMHLPGRMQYLLLGKYAAWKRSSMLVFKSKKAYGPGDQLELGGPGLADMTDLQYIAAFRHEPVWDASEAVAPSLMHDSFVPQEPIGQGDREAYPAPDFPSWFTRFAKAVKRNRVADVRFMIDTELERGDQSFLLQPEVSYAPPNEQEVLVVDLAVRASNLEMLCLLVHLGRCSLSYKALKYLVHHWEDCPVAYTTTLNILLTYLLRHPGPLAVVSAVMTALRAEMRQRHKRKPTAALEEALAAFQQLQHLCLAKLQEILRKFGADDQELMPRMEAILDPPRLGPSLLISEMRPLRMAFDDSDAPFMNAPLVASYLQKIWMGKEYVLETCKDGRRALSSLDPSFGFAILLNLGFCPPSAVTLEYAMRLWHLCCLSQRAFYNSPRARWAVRFLGSILYFVAFLQVVGTDIIPSWAPEANSMDEWVQHQTTNSILFLVCIAGNALEALVVLLTRYHLDAIRFMKREPLQMLYLGVDMLMLFLTTSYVLRINHRMDDMDDGLFTRLTFVWAAMGPLVTGRLLLVMVPLLERLGPLLNTVQSMLLDLATFALPWLFLTAGFAVSLQVVFSNAHSEEDTPIERLSIFNSFWETMFFLFRGFTDKFDYTLFEEVPSREARVYGQAILAIYFTLCGLLLANLLIAIITHRYRPEDTKEQNALNMAQIIDNHQHQVERCLLSSPFNLVCLLFSWLPEGRRRKVHPYYWWTRGLPLLDGFTPASPRFPTVATGGAAVPHLLFLLCLLPLIWATALALVLVHAPLCILYFAAKGHQKFLVEVDELLGTGPRSGKRRSWGRVSQGGEAPWESSPNASSSAPAQRQDRSAAGASTFGTAAISRRRSGSNSGIMDASELSHVPGHDAGRQPFRLASLLTAEGLWAAAQQVPRFLLFLLIGTLLFVITQLVVLQLVYTVYGWFGSVAWCLRDILLGAWVQLWGDTSAASMPSTGTRSTSPDPDASTNNPPPTDTSPATTEDVRAASRATGCFWWKRKPAANQVTPGPKPCKDDGARKAVQYTSQQAAMAKALDEFEARIRNKRANELNYIEAHELQALIVAVFGPQFASKDTGLDAPSPSAPWVPRPPQARSTSQVDLFRPSGTHLGPGLPTQGLPLHSMTTQGASTRGKRHSQVAWGPSLAASLLARGLHSSSRQPGSSLGPSSRLGPEAPPPLGQVGPAAASLPAGDQGSGEGRGGGTALSSVAGVASVRKVAQLWLGAGLSPRQVPTPKQLPAGQESQEHPADQQQQQSETQQDVELQQQQQLEQQLEPQLKAAPAGSRPSCLTLPTLAPYQSPPSLPGPAKASPPDLLPLLLLLNMQLLQRLGPSCNQAAGPQQLAPCRSPALTARSKGSRPEGRPRPSQSHRSSRSEVRGRAVRSARPSTRQLASHSRSTTLSSLSTSRSMSDAATSLAPGPADPDCQPAVGSMLPEQTGPMLVHPHPPPPLELHSPQHDVHLPVPCTLPEWPGAIAVAPASPPYLPQYEPHIQSLASHPNDSLRPAARLELEVEGEQGPQPLNHPQPLPRPLDHPPQLHNQHQPQPRDQRRDQRHHQHQEQQQKVLQQQHEHRQQEEQQGQQQQQPAQPASTARTTAATREVLAPIKISGAIRGAHLLMPLNSSPALLED